MRECVSNIVPSSDGCDFIVSLDAKRENTKIKVLQMTDMQIIDSSQRRTSDRLRMDEVNAWAPENFDVQCGNQIRSLVAQTNPDIILVTGDMVYGSFDDKGSTFLWFCHFMDSLAIPWAPVFGNHDNESKMGVSWQCEQFEKSKYCVFKRGNVSGNGNYTVGIRVGEQLLRVIHMLDSNGCTKAEEKTVIQKAGIYPDQIAFIKEKTKQIENQCGAKIPAFLAFHIPTKEFEDAEAHSGYKTESREFYTIGVDAPKKNDDFGFKWERMKPIETDEAFLDTLKACNVDGVFAGHCHSICTSIEYEGIRWTFGLKTGQYDYHIPGQLGGTRICLENSSFDVAHVPSLNPYGPFPKGAKMFDTFFAEDKYIVGEN